MCRSICVLRFLRATGQYTRLVIGRKLDASSTSLANHLISLMQFLYHDCDKIFIVKKTIILKYRPFPTKNQFFYLEFGFWDKTIPIKLLPTNDSIFSVQRFNRMSSVIELDVLPRKISNTLPLRRAPTASKKVCRWREIDVGYTRAHSSPDHNGPKSYGCFGRNSDKPHLHAYEIQVTVVLRRPDCWYGSPRMESIVPSAK